MASILIALDRHHTLLDTLRTRLATAGHLVVTTHDGAEAWDLASTCLFDCGLVDARLQTLPGPALVHRLRAAPGTRDLDVVLLARDEQDRMRLLSRVGDDVAAVLAHPVEAEDILDALRLHFGVAAAAAPAAGAPGVHARRSEPNAESSLP